MHRKRIITAAIVLPVAYTYVMFLPPVFFTALLCAGAALGIHEFYSMYGVKGPLKPAGTALGAVIPAGAHLAGNVHDYLAASFIVLVALRLFTRKSPSSALKETATVIVGLLYIPALLGFQTELRALGPEWIIFLYAAIWGADSAAYYIGTGIGRRKLYASISPNKTVEGAVASVVGGTLSALAVKVLLSLSITYEQAALLGAATGTVAIVGDLVESMFKRDAGVKDSGALLPGHGGILDKIDGVLFAGPVLYWALSALGIS
jgi:phosphatidate cytidylyltransferase